MIFVNYTFVCDRCDTETSTDIYNVAIGDRPPTVVPPAGWNGVDTGRILCPPCCAEPVEPEIVLT
jgi:hypothetical protein